MMIRRLPFAFVGMGLMLLPIISSCGRVEDQPSKKTLHVALFQAPASEALVDLIPQFEESEGVEVTYEILPYAELKSKIEQQFFAKTGDYDVIMADCIWIPSFAARGYLGKVVTSSVDIGKYGFEDIFPALDDYLSRYPKNGPRYGMPFMSNTHMMAYRAPLVEPVAASLALGLPRETRGSAWQWEDYLRVAETITSREGEEGTIDEREEGQSVFGTSLQARSGAWIVYEWYSVLFGFIKESQARVTGLPTFDENAAAAMAFYAQMYDAAPEAALTWGHEEETSAMCAGLTAMDATSNVELAANLLRPECNPEELRFAYPPVGPDGRGSPDMGGYGLMVAGQAKDLPLASRFVLWAASRDIHRQVVLAGGTPIRLSEVQDQEILTKFPYLSFYDTLIDDSVYRARVTEWPELQDVISRELTAVMQGQKKPPAAAQQVQNWVEANIE